jgi:Ca2+-binding EF-hand superfamily protein
MLTDFQKKKLSRLFAVLDSDHNNKLERSDYTTVVANLAKIHGWAPGSPQYAQTEELYLTIWDNLQMLADQNSDKQVSLEEFLQFHAQMLGTPELYEQITVGTVNLLFDAFDRDQDGTLSRDDFRDFFDAYGIRDKVADEAFQKLDSSGDGQISKEEAMQRIQEYYFSDDPAAPGNWLFGRYA